MAKHILTQEHIDQLRLSPYILSVTQSQIRYTDELKALYYQKKTRKSAATIDFTIVQHFLLVRY